MVLNGPGPTGRGRTGPGSPSGSPSGVTLIELLVGISLSAVVIGFALALFKDAGLAARMGSHRRDAGFQADIAFASLADNLMTGGGILRLAPGRLDLLNIRGRRVGYAWADSILSANENPWDFRLASLEIAPMGPMRPGWKDFAVETPWDLDSLDGDRDGRIDFDELDRDRSGELDPEECRFIAGIRITMTTVERGIATTQACTVHPRNRVPSAAATDDEIPYDGGIPEP